MRVRGFILNGASFTRKTANTLVPGCELDDGLFECRFRTADADGAVIDLDGIDLRAQIGLAERDVAGRDVLAHQRAEAFDFSTVDVGRRRLTFDSVECASRPNAIGQTIRGKLIGSTQLVSCPWLLIGAGSRRRSAR
jgi:hypothetical protein